MSFTPARTIAYAGCTRRTSRGSRARISSEVSPLIPRFKTVHSGAVPFLAALLLIRPHAVRRGGGDRRTGHSSVVWTRCPPDRHAGPSDGSECGPMHPTNRPFPPDLGWGLGHDAFHPGGRPEA